MASSARSQHSTYNSSAKYRNASSSDSFPSQNASPDGNRTGSAMKANFDDKIRMPSFNIPSKNTQKTDDNNMYKEESLAFSQNDIRNRKNEFKENLTIFAPLPSEEKEEPVVQHEEIKMERPVTPIDREIRRQPYEWEQMNQYVRRRIAADSKVEHLSMQDQSDLSEILVAEVYHIWPEIKRQIDDPFLSSSQNIELNRRIAVHIVTVCEQLYQHYLKKAQILMKRNVFSTPANMSRLKALLGIEASKYLNVLTIRRYIVADMQGHLPELESTTDSKYKHSVKPSVPKPSVPKMSFKGMLKQSRPKKSVQKRHWKTVEEDIQEMKENMPELETSKLIAVLAEMPRELLEGGMDAIIGTEKQERITRRSEVDIDDTIMATAGEIFMQRSESLPELHVGETLLQELGIESQPPDQKQSTSLDKHIYRHRSHEVLYVGKNDEKDRQATIFYQGLTRDVINLDVKKLTEVKKEPPQQLLDDEDDLPPLLQAIIRHRKHDGMETVHKKKIKELEKKERFEIEQNTAPLQEPQHPQPDTVAQKMPNKTIVRTSDIRVSERMCMESVTIKQHTTVYNDLLDEIDSATMKRLDANLFLGDEIKEVYTEIMKTVPTDHLNPEQDELIEKCPENIDLSGLMASSTLTMKKAIDRMINPHLKMWEEAPWGNPTDKAAWSKTLQTLRSQFGGPIPARSVTPSVTPRYAQELRRYSGSMELLKLYRRLVDPVLATRNGCPSTPPKDSKGMDHFESLEPNTENIAFASNPHAGKLGGINFSDLPAMVAERMSRSYASWLTWWKSTVNSEDYMKYLCTQETDFLGSVYHFYDSDAEEDNEEDLQATKMDELSHELEEKKAKKLAELRNKKQEFTPGMWNAQTVFLGGLGKDPDVSDDVDVERIKSAIKQEQLEAQGKKRILGDVVKERIKSGKTLNSQNQDGETPHTTVYSASKGAPTSRMESTFTEVTNKKKAPSPQDRLEKIWASLYIPDKLKLDMAIKYSSDAFTDTLDQVISSWEAATELILQRESIIAELETFERLASDPNRFFESGYRGSSNARFQEAKMRSQLYMKLENIHQRVYDAVKYVLDTYNDNMTYQGRPYLDKMHWDRTEMLYWLQEERKQHAIGIQESLAVAGKSALHKTAIIPNI